MGIVDHNSGGFDENFSSIVDESEGGENAGGTSLGGTAAYAFTINYIFGAGVLGVPYAIAHAGIVGSSVALVLFSAMSCAAMIWVVEACARGEAYVASGAYKIETPSANWANLSASFTASIADETSLRGSMLEEEDDKLPGMQGKEVSYAITTRRFEVAELAEMFLGRRARQIFDISVTVFSLVSMWLYAVLFALSLAETLPLPFITSDSCTYDDGLFSVSTECRMLYWVYLLVFFVMMLITTTHDLSGQVRLQQTLTLMAFTCVGIMIVTVIAALASTADGHMQEPDSEFEASAIWFNEKGFGKAFSTFVFAQLCHHGIPGLIQLIDDKKSCKTVFVGAISTTCSIYLLLGIPCAIFFGKSGGVDQGINKVVTLNWGQYTAGGIAWHDFIKYVVRLYPAISVFAAFPLYATTLGINWEALLPDSYERTTRLKIGMRWCAVIPGMIGASILSDASVIIAIGGLFGFVIEMIMPALLNIYSAKKCQQHIGGSADTPYKWHFSHMNYSWGVLTFSGFALVYAVISLVRGWVS